MHWHAEMPCACLHLHWQRCPACTRAATRECTRATSPSARDRGSCYIPSSKHISYHSVRIEAIGSPVRAHISGLRRRTRIEEIGSIFTRHCWEGGSEERSKGRAGKGGRAHIRTSSHPHRSRASQRGPRPDQVSRHRARGGASRAAPARLHRRHLTRVLRRPRRSEPGGPGPRVPQPDGPARLAAAGVGCNQSRAASPSESLRMAAPACSGTVVVSVTCRSAIARPPMAWLSRSLPLPPGVGA